MEPRCALLVLFLSSLTSQSSAPTGDAGPGAANPLFDPPLRVLHELRGEAAGDQFGWIARNAGDCDGDGTNDVWVSAPMKALGGPAAGRVYLYSGKSGRLLWQRDGQPGDTLGMGIERAGDVDGDGRSDVIAGAPNRAGGRGAALVYSGRDGALLHTFSGAAANDGFGNKVGAAGDVDGDGRADVLVGAENCDSFGADAGRAYLFSGKDGSVLLELDGEDAGDKFGSTVNGWASGGDNLILIGASDAGERQGGRVYVFTWKAGEAELVTTVEADATGVGLGRMFLSVVGDVDADGFPDVYASDWENNALGNSTGRVYVVSGRSGKPLWTFTGERAGDGFGIGTADVGDCDGDGHADLLIGAWQNASGAPSGGKCYLHSGRDGALLGAWACTVANETFGFDTTGLGDVDGDGALDFLITSAWSGVNGRQSGRVFVLAGELGRVAK